MDIDSPIGANGLGGRPNGIATTSTTAKLTEMMPLYRPTKVSFNIPGALTTAYNCKKLFRREHSEAAGGKPSGSTSVTSLDFDNEGGLLLTSESDSSMQVYNIKEGKHHKTLLSQKYGCMHALFAHAPGTIIHSSTKINRKLYSNLLAPLC